MSQEQSPRAHYGEFSATQRSSAVDDSVRATTIMGPSGVGGSAMAANTDDAVCRGLMTCV